MARKFKSGDKVSHVFGRTGKAWGYAVNPEAGRLVVVWMADDTRQLTYSPEDNLILTPTTCPTCGCTNYRG